MTQHSHKIPIRPLTLQKYLLFQQKSLLLFLFGLNSNYVQQTKLLFIYFTFKRTNVFDLFV